jgi:hypothetical protein
MKKLSTVMGLVVCCALFARAEQVLETKWCKITVPDSAKVDTPAVIKVELGTIPEGMQVKIDLHGKSTAGKYLKANKIGGPQPGKTGETLTFSLAPKSVPDLGSVHAVVIMSPTGGWADRVETATTKDIPILP